MKRFWIIFFASHTFLNAQGVVSDAWKNAQKTSAQSKRDAAQTARDQIGKFREKLEKIIIERPNATEDQTGCAQKKLANLKQLSDVINGTDESLQSALQENDQDNAAIQYGKISATHKKAEQVYKDGAGCFGEKDSQQPRTESFEESQLRSSTAVATAPGSEATTNAPNKPIVVLTEPPSPR